MFRFDPYKARKTEFIKVLTVWDWNVKVYTITNRNEFKARPILDRTMLSLPGIFNEINKSSLATYNQAFLIVHEAREGVWILLNWWTGREMIETKVFFSDHNSLDEIKPSTHKNGLLCVWELEVFKHERDAWISHILSQPGSPDFESYLNDNLTIEI